MASGAGTRAEAWQAPVAGTVGKERGWQRAFVTPSSSWPLTMPAATMALAAAIGSSTDTPAPWLALSACAAKPWKCLISESWPDLRFARLCR